jgi:hypothetical protein
MMAQEVEHQFRLTAPRAEVEIRQEDRAIAGRAVVPGQSAPRSAASPPTRAFFGQILMSLG